MSSLASVFADAALKYQERMSAGVVLAGVTQSRDDLLSFYKTREADLSRFVRSRPLDEVCASCHIGQEGRAILTRFVENFNDRGR